MNLSLDNVWLAIAAMGVLTYMTRSLPFLLAGRSQALNRLADPASPLASLGPCLLVAITSSTIVPMLAASLQAGGGRLLPAVGGLLTTLGVMKRWENVGLAVVVGMVVYTAGLAAMGGVK